MSTIVTRAVKGSALTHNEVDANFNNLNTDKLQGTVAIANGGTGETIANNSFNALAPIQTGNSGKYLTTNGTTTSWNTVSSTGTVTSVGGTGTVNGITLTGTVTSSGSLTLGGTLSGVNLATQVTGTLPLANGGTGQTTAQAAINSFAGTVTSGSYLRGNGTNVVMSTIQAADVPTLNQNTTGSAATVTGNATGSTFGFNSGYGSVATAYGCRAWVNFNGTGVVAIRASGNVSSITDNGVGDYTVNFTTAMSDANYSATGGGTTPSARSFGIAFNIVSSSGAAVAPTSTALRVSTFQPSSNLGIDVDYAYVSIFR